MSILTRIGSALGLSVRGARPSIARGRIVPDVSLWQQFTRIGGSLTPQQVSSIIRLADTGDMWQLMDLANDARQKDCHLQTVLQTSEESIAGLDWDIIPAKDAKSSERKAAEWVKGVLKETPELVRLFAHHSGARYYGHGVSEIEWVRRDGDLIPERFEFLAPRRFAYRQVDGKFVWRDSGMAHEGVDLADYPGRFIVSHPRVTGDVPCREGLVRVLMWAALFRNWSISDWLRLGEIAWKPWRTGTYQKDASLEDIANLSTILEGMTSSGTAVYPDTTKVEVQWAGSKGGGQTAGGGQSELYDKMAAEMSKAVLGQTLTTEQGKVGSQALGNVQNEVRKDLREAGARSVASDITRDLVAQIYALNFPPSIRVSPFVFITQDAAEISSFAVGVKALKEAGTRIPELWVYDRVGIPAPEDGDRCLGDIDIPIDPTTGLPQDPPVPDKTAPSGPKDEAA